MQGWVGERVGGGWEAAWQLVVCLDDGTDKNETDFEIGDQKRGE